MKTIAELRAMVESARPSDGDDISTAMRRIADVHLALVGELVDRMEGLDERMNQIAANETARVLGTGDF